MQADPLHYDVGIEINGVTWATRNVGPKGTFASTPQDFGEYYDYETAVNSCPEGWRLPSISDIEKLIGYSDVYAGGSLGKLHLPLAGHLRNAKPNRHNELGFYWVGGYSQFGHHQVLQNTLDHKQWWAILGYSDRRMFSVRCVKDK